MFGGMQVNNDFNINEIVRIETMPKVFSQLEMIGKYIDEQIKDIDSLDCTEENKQEVKKRRTEINNTLKVLEDKRKEIKTTLLEPYETFNDKYENECKIKLQNASDLLKNKIDDIENIQLNEKQEELELFAKEYFNVNQIEDIVCFDDIGLNITLSASMKSLKEQIIAFCEKIVNDLKLIELEEYKDEILVEYKKNLDFSKSKLEVISRKKQLEELHQQQEIKQEENKQEEKIIKRVEEIINIPEEIIEINFKIKTTKEKAKKVREFLKDEGIEYE